MLRVRSKNSLLSYAGVTMMCSASSSSSVTVLPFTFTMHCFSLPGQMSSISLPGKTPSCAMRAQILRLPLILHTLNLSRPQAEDNGVVVSGCDLFLIPHRLNRYGQDIFGGFLVTRHLNKVARFRYTKHLSLSTVFAREICNSK